jgi:hypothetical protein
MEQEMKTRLILPTVLVSVVFVSPALGNWFSNPEWNINLHVGSAPNPTPDDVRAGHQPMLVRDADGNIIAMIDPVTGKVIATAEPPPSAARPRSVATPAKAAAAPLR